MKLDGVLFGLALIFAASAPSLAVESHLLFTAVLADHVQDGLVNYRTLRADKRLDQYIQQLAQTDPDGIVSEKARLAFWINAYNAHTLKLICDNYPVKSINDLHGRGFGLRKVLRRTVWDRPLITINNRKTTLNAIEHEIIRPLFNDPRIHFALVCAAKSCPPLRSEAYEGDKLDDQLDDQGRQFLTDISNNSFNTEEKTAKMSRIFSWFARDFGGSNEEILTYIARFLPKDIADQIRANPRAWTVRYNEYDWSLNERHSMK
ncbi:MAG: DUF547 domain-containing protein [Candidatus Hydrogenedentes bacterium]|nr:DUF547 domain-containing protein [Candidatus Hydrogenedentota bacterium]